MNFNRVMNNLSSSVDPGAVLRQEVEEAISPITERVDRLEKKIDLLILTVRGIQPLSDLVLKLPFFKK
jgi:hypothetical protein